MPLFRKKPVVIEAEQFLKDQPLPFRDRGNPLMRSCDRGWFIETLEGYLKVSDGDWIVRGTQGEFYPVKDPIFRTVYDPEGEGSERLDHSHDSAYGGEGES